MWEHVEKETHCSKVEITIVNSWIVGRDLFQITNLAEYEVFIQPGACGTAVFKHLNKVKSPIEILI